MRKKKIDPDMPVGKLTVVKDFLPPPHELVFLEDTVKITLAIKRSSLEFFKEQARKSGAKYQRMIRELLDRYSAQYDQ